MAPPKSHQRLGVRAAKQSGAAALAGRGREGERPRGSLPRPADEKRWQATRTPRPRGLRSGPTRSRQRLGVRAAKQKRSCRFGGERSRGREVERSSGPEVRCLVRRTKSGGKPHALQDLADSSRGRLGRDSVLECGSPLPRLPRTGNAGSSSPNTKAAEDCRTPKASPFLRNGAVHGHSTVAVAAMNAWRSRMKPLSLLVGFCLAVAADSVEGPYTDIETAVGGQFFLTPQFGFRPCHRVRNRVGSRLLFAEFPR